MKVEVNHLVKRYGNFTAVDDISFSFSSGHIFGFVGPNGAGKTTTMRIIATLDEPSEGEVKVNGISVTEHPQKVRHLVGYVPDLLPAHSDITVFEYLDFFARAYGLRGRDREEAVEGVIEFTGLAPLREKLLKALSKGMKQRVNLGRALVHDPPVLVLDEPAAGLDPRARVELRELLSILAEHEKAVLISSHILTELTEICNGVVIIEQGKLLETGTIDEVTDRSENFLILRIRVIGKTSDLRLELLQSPHVEQVRKVGDAIEVELHGSDAEAADVLGHLVQRGFRICEFRTEQADLEDIFMRVTQGEVQ